MDSVALFKKHVKKRQKEPFPRVYNCQLEELLKKKFGSDYTLEAVASYLGVTTVTMRSILRGGTVSLENAIKLSSLAGKKITEIWELV